MCPLWPPTTFTMYAKRMPRLTTCFWPFRQLQPLTMRTECVFLTMSSTSRAKMKCERFSHICRRLWITLSLLPTPAILTLNSASITCRSLRLLRERTTRSILENSAMPDFTKGTVKILHRSFTTDLTMSLAP